MEHSVYCCSPSVLHTDVPSEYNDQQSERNENCQVQRPQRRHSWDFTLILPEGPSQYPEVSPQGNNSVAQNDCNTKTMSKLWALKSSSHQLLYNLPFLCLRFCNLSLPASFQQNIRIFQLFSFSPSVFLGADMVSVCKLLVCNLESSPR